MNIKYILVLCFTIHLFGQTVAYRRTVEEARLDDYARNTFVNLSYQHSSQFNALTAGQILNYLGDKYQNYVDEYLVNNHKTRNDLIKDSPDDESYHEVLFGKIVFFICGKMNTTIREFLNNPDTIKRFHSHKGPLTTKELSLMLKCDSDVARYMEAKKYTPDDLSNH
ncbi:uncharacterized protein LOC126842193 [Adelges cooleyi]|uniref:uncharacterized protein LOC126842193 n=1 Tax=Adelges cooleyi TaxID=133065 RepID=UPI00217FFDC4|nr:uncharacterized protein LOC126842193 [Adelges cooleyi]